jgi:hypothetical protein
MRGLSSDRRTNGLTTGKHRGPIASPVFRLLAAVLFSALLAPVRIAHAGESALGDPQSPMHAFTHLLGSHCAWAADRAANGMPLPPDSFMYFGEYVGSRASWPSSTAWGLEFRKSFCTHFALSMAYLNDGHFPGHHRDGVSGEMWVPFTISRYVTLSLGGGPFYYFDTELASNENGYADVHGWAWLLSADMRVPLWWGHARHPGWFADIRYDWSAPAKDIETHSIGFGIGYQMYSDFAVGASTRGTVEGFAVHEIVGYVGKTVVNSFSSQWSYAEALEYREQLFVPFARVSVALVNEGDARLIRRNGVIYEAWLEPSFWDGNASESARPFASLGIA